MVSFNGNNVKEDTRNFRYHRLFISFDQKELSFLFFMEYGCQHYQYSGVDNTFRAVVSNSR